MLPADLISTLKTLALTDRPLVTATPDKATANAAKQFEVGQKLQATVQAQVAPNVFNVRVANQMLQMQLPAFIKSGDTIALQVVSLQPRLTFTLAASANPVSTPESLSAAAKMLSSLSQQPLERSYVRPIQSAPLWTGEQALPDPAQLADKLHNALSHSGLFYESHQAQWIAGMRPTTQLLLEPQNQLTQELKLQLQGSPQMQEQTRGALDQAQQARSTQPSDTNGVNTTGVTTAASSLAGSEQRTASIPPHLQTLVQQQLNALETRQVLWQGPVWQGQEMRWEVREEPPRRGAQGQTEGQWITQISLDLPNLGGVSAQLSFSGNRLSLSLQASNAETRDRLGNATSQLVAALSERGIPVTHTQISQPE